MTLSTKQKLFIGLQHIVPQHFLSRAVGSIASSENHWVKSTFINYFAKKYEIDMSEAAEARLDAYASFNDFFTRALKDGARPIDQDRSSIVSPADGAVSECGVISRGRLIQAKGQDFSLHTLLGAQHDLTETFLNGHFATIYLSPKDYHRVHMPFDGILRKTIYVPGDLYSVNQTTADGVPGLFARNERLICIFDTHTGPMALILVGAMIVAAIETVWSGQVCPVKKSIKVDTFDDQGRKEPVKLNKGDEMGRFKLGSTAIIVTPEKTIDWDTFMKAGTPLKMGQRIGFLAS